MPAQEVRRTGARDPDTDLGMKDLSKAAKTSAVRANVLLAAISAGLAVWANGVGRWLLGGVVLLALVLFGSQVVWGSIRLRHQRELASAREEVARATERAAAAAAEAASAQALRDRHTAVLAALHGMWLGYPAPYTDEVELTYLIGPDAAGDRVVEHRRTTPSPGAALPFLQGRLTAPTQLGADAVTLDDVEIVTRSEDDRTAIRQFALTEKPGLLRCMFVFTPSITEPTSWYARYRMPGMWDVLRETGHDRLAWTPAAAVADPARSTLSRLTVNFDFPPDTGEGVFVRDREHRELTRLTGPDGSLRYRWTCDSPLPERYTFELWLAREPAGSRPTA